MSDILVTGVSAGGGVAIVLGLVKATQMALSKIPMPVNNDSRHKDSAILAVCKEKFRRFDDVEKMVHEVHCAVIDIRSDVKHLRNGG